MDNQPEVTIDEYLNNPANLQMIDHLLNERGDKILATLLMKGVKPPSDFDTSQYYLPTSVDPQTSQNFLGSSYVPQGAPTKNMYHPEFGNSIIDQVQDYPHLLSMTFTMPPPDPNDPSAHGMPSYIPSAPPLPPPYPNFGSTPILTNFLPLMFQQPLVNPYQSTTLPTPLQHTATVVASS